MWTRITVFNGFQSSDSVCKMLRFRVRDAAHCIVGGKSSDWLGSSLKDVCKEGEGFGQMRTCADRVGGVSGVNLV